MNKEELIAKLVQDLEDYRTAKGDYNGPEFFERCQAKADYIEELLALLVG